jgi:hypothetical protein
MTENIGNGVSLEMVKIPGGRFLMGSPETEVKRNDDEGPQHYVNVPEFLMGKYTVTQAQWQAVMGNNPSYFKGKNRPVEKVSWNDATKLTVMGQKENIEKKQQMWEFFHPIVLACTICTGMSGNGVRMLGMITMMEHLLMEVLGSMEVIAVVGCVAAAPGPSFLGGVALRTAASISRSSRSTTLLVFVL